MFVLTPGMSRRSSSRVAADLAQLEQGVQDGHLALGHALFVDIPENLILELLGHGRIQFHLLVFQGAVVDVLHLGRQVLGHVGLLAAQDEGFDPHPELFQGFLVPVLDRPDEPAVKGVLGSEKSGHQEFEQRPQFQQVVLDGRAGETEPEAGVEPAHGPGGDGVRVFDVLGFVQDDAVEFDASSVRPCPGAAGHRW
jgi:hypothetical protein